MEPRYSYLSVNGIEATVIHNTRKGVFRVYFHGRAKPAPEDVTAYVIDEHFLYQFGEDAIDRWIELNVGRPVIREDIALKMMEPRELAIDILPLDKSSELCYDEFSKQLNKGGGQYAYARRGAPALRHFS